MIRLNKFFSALLAIGLLLIGCQAIITDEGMPTVLPNATTTYTAFPASSPTLLPTPSDTPDQILSLMSPECERLDPAIYTDYWGQYGGMGCKLPAISPDGKYLAYVTLATQTDDLGTYICDVVRVIELGTANTIIDVYIVQRMGYIGILEWSSSGQLVFWESIWEGSGRTIAYDPSLEAILTTIQADQNTAWQWNPQHTAFYSVRSGGYGADRCVQELSGFDFQSNSVFPDLYSLFNIGREDLPNVLGDNLYVEPYAWSSDGRYLWLTVTPLDWLGDERYEFLVGPKEAGLLELTESGVMYRALAADPQFDYFFDGLPDPRIISRDYQSNSCP